MHVVVGPVSSHSARSWLAYARSVVADIQSVAPNRSCSSPEVVAIFEEYLDMWDEVAFLAGDDPFRWEYDVPVEAAEYHMHAFNQVANVLADRAARGEGVQAPDESDEFYIVLVNSLLAAFVDCSPSSAEFAQHLGAFWPGPVNV